MDIKLNSENDISVVGSDLEVFGSYEDSLAQRVKIRVLSYLGEWFEDINNGVPYYQIILQSKDKTIADTFIKKTIIETKGVVSIQTYTSRIINQKLVISFTAKITTGLIIEQVLEI